MRGRFIMGALLAVSVTTGCSAPMVRASVPAIATVPLSIKSAKGVHRFNVEVARSPEEQERGLMFRAHIDPNGGMIFPMDPPRMASFWMKNTVSSLDLLFIRADGTIARIAADAVPYSMSPIDSGEPVAAVLEIAGGRAAQLGISEDDKVLWRH
ncbi:MAG: hypothetical protein JWL66_1042 [Sphingomonadales bacterium]|jgi:uncharacterized membrane protein (UPF0127 family)|nr:hypothetical protein [Sphingomonadales bacterium]